jgi:hypothetical protein
VQYAVDLLYILGLYLSKFSMNLLFLRLNPWDEAYISVRAVFVLSAALFLISEFIVALRCSTSPWNDNTHNCSSMVSLPPLAANLAVMLFMYQMQKWDAVAAFDIASESLLFALCIGLFIGLRMPKGRKAKVFCVFGFRLG